MPYWDINRKKAIQNKIQISNTLTFLYFDKHWHVVYFIKNVVLTKYLLQLDNVRQMLSIKTSYIFESVAIENEEYLAYIPSFRFTISMHVL